MKKLMMVVFAAFMAACFFTGCDNTKVESSWEKAKTAHAITKAAGVAAIERGVVSDKTAEKLKTLNSTVETGGSMAESVYKRVKPPEQEEAR